MPKAKNGNINIYYEIEGEGPPLVLSHGFFATLETWRESGYVDALKKDYRLILMDSRGHGKSDKPHNPEAYTGEQRAKDIIAVLEELDVSRANFFGYSAGGRIGLEFAKRSPERTMSVIIGGTGSRGMSPEDRNQIIQMLETGPEAMIASIEKRSGPMRTTVKERFLAADFGALIASVKAPIPSLDDDLPGMTMPFLVYFGESDPSIEFKGPLENLPDVTFFTLPGLNHAQAFSRSDLVLPHIKEFLARVSRI